MTFKQTAEEVLRNEIDKAVKEAGFFLETPFCLRIFEKYDGFFALSTIRLTLRRVHAEMGLTKRYLTDELGRFFGLTTRGHPIVYYRNDRLV